MNEFKVTVIIPVYNAAGFVTQAVESALEQPETAEVLLVEDGSPDNALEICQVLSEKYTKVRLLRHPNGENRGAGASRNLGMVNAQNEYIAFLDADDYYLPNRFNQPEALFTNGPTCDGVYEAVRMQVESKAGLERWELAGKTITELKTMNPGIPPEQLAERLLQGTDGYFHLDGLVVKKAALQKTGLMNEDLRLHQDTEFILRLAMTAKLYPGMLDEPVAMWRVHSANRISAQRSLKVQYRDRMKYWRSLYQWVGQYGSLDQQQMVRNAIFSYNRAAKFHAFHRRIVPTRVIIFGRQLRLLAWSQLIVDQIKYSEVDKVD